MCAPHVRSDAVQALLVAVDQHEVAAAGSQLDGQRTPATRIEKAVA